MNKLFALADRVEKLTGPDREVDAEIADAIGWWLSERERLGPNAPMVMEAGRFTGSLDAAMTLVPKGHMWMVESTGFYARVECYPGAGESAALALVAASLRARAHGGGEG